MISFSQLNNEPSARAAFFFAKTMPYGLQRKRWAAPSAGMAKAFGKFQLQFMKNFDTIK